MRRSALPLAASFVAALLCLTDSDASAETRQITSIEHFSLTKAASTFVTQTNIKPTATGKASCVAKFSGTQTFPGAAMPVWLKVDVMSNDTQLATRTGITQVSIDADVTSAMVSAAPNLRCRVALAIPAAITASATGDVTQSVPMDVQQPQVTQTAMMGTKSWGVQSYQTADYGSPGAAMKVTGKYLQGAKITVAGVAVTPIATTSGDTALYFTLPSVPKGSTQLVIENQVGKVSLPFLVGTPVPEITKVSLSTYNRLTIFGKYLDPALPGSQKPMKPVVKIGDTEFTAGMVNDSQLDVTLPKAYHGPTTVKTAGGESNSLPL